MTLQKQLILGYSLVIMVLCGVATVSFNMIEILVDSEQQVAHKAILDKKRGIMDEMLLRFQVDGNVKGEVLTERIAKAMVDQETGERGLYREIKNLLTLYHSTVI